MINTAQRLCLFAVVLLVGCVGGEDLQTESRWKIKVLCEQQPLAEVQVILHRQVGSKWEAVLEGISRGDGIAQLQVVPTIDPPKAEEWKDFRVTVTSLAGGEWLIKEKWTSPAHTDLRIAQYEPEALMILEVPKQAIGSL